MSSWSFSTPWSPHSSLYLMVISAGRQTYKSVPYGDDGGTNLPAVKWLLDVWSNLTPFEGPATKHQVIRVENDQLLINGLNVCTEGLCPISKQVNAFFAFDRNRDGQTDLSQPDPVLSALPFIQGADVYVRASSPPDDTVSFQLISRGGGGVRTLNVPNWDAITDGVTLQWNDFDKLTF